MENYIGNVVPGSSSSPDSGNLAATRWTDKSFPFNRERQGVTFKPDFDFNELGLLFPQNDPSEKTYFLDQCLHEKKLGSDIHLHIHYIQTTAATPIFKAEYRYYNNGDDIPASWITITTTGIVIPWSGNPMLQIIVFPSIPAPTNEDVSANIDLIVYRDDNLVPGDILTKYLDYHFEKDSDGSRQEYIK